MAIEEWRNLAQANNSKDTEAVLDAGDAIRSSSIKAGLLSLPKKIFPYLRERGKKFAEEVKESRKETEEGLKEGKMPKIGGKEVAVGGFSHATKVAAGAAFGAAYATISPLIMEKLFGGKSDQEKYDMVKSVLEEATTKEEMEGVYKIIDTIQDEKLKTEIIEFEARRFQELPFERSKNEVIDENNAEGIGKETEADGS